MAILLQWISLERFSPPGSDGLIELVGSDDDNAGLVILLDGEELYAVSMLWTIRNLDGIISSVSDEQSPVFKEGN